MIITHIIERERWEGAMLAGTYHAESLDSEGFIHFSKPEQVERTANRFYHGKTDLVLLIIETDRVKGEVIFEPPSHPTFEGEVFPHVYGELNTDAVIRVVDLPMLPDGSFKFDPSAI